MKLKRIVSMLTRMAMKFDVVVESSVDYVMAIEYEHRDAEHEHARATVLGRAPKDGLHDFTNGK